MKTLRSFCGNRSLSVWLNRIPKLSQFLGVLGRAISCAIPPFSGPPQRISLESSCSMRRLSGFTRFLKCLPGLSPLHQELDFTAHCELQAGLNQGCL